MLELQEDVLALYHDCKSDLCNLENAQILSICAEEENPAECIEMTIRAQMVSPWEC